MTAALKSALTRQPHLSRFILHLHQRAKHRRLTVITGAGISADAKVPSWNELLTRLGSVLEDKGAGVADHQSRNTQPEYLGQIVYHRFRSSNRGKGDVDDWTLDVDDKWASAIRDCLYQDVKGDISDILKAHPYLTDLCRLCFQSSLVINFNFDDILDDAMASLSGTGEFKGYRALTSTRAPIADRDRVTSIYHVNGVLPRITLKKRSDQLIFTEDSFANAASRAPDVFSDALFVRFLQNTMLIVGHSLSDSSLKSFLRKSKQRSPANHHYMIHWLSNEKQLTDDARSDIFEANLELYNTITIFLTSGELGCLLSMISEDKAEFLDRWGELGANHGPRLHYYIAGPVAAGKSSLLEHLRCFETFEEWTRPPPKEMFRSFESLNDGEIAKIDQFVYSELREKNNLMVEATPGIYFMDRAPLDLYAFSSTPEEVADKTRNLRAQITDARHFQDGEIVFLTADGKTLVRRNFQRGRRPEDAGNEEYLETQRDTLKSVYRDIFEIETARCSPGQVAKLAARHALLEPYSPVNFSNIMSRYDKK